MRISHVITRLVVGGAQENTLTTVKGLQRVPGLTLFLVAGPTRGAEGTLLPEVKAAHINFQLVPNLVRPVHPAKDLLALHCLTRIFREQRPHIVHTHSGKAGILGRLAAAKAAVPIIIHHIHGPSFGPFQGTAANWLFRNAEQYAARVTSHFVCSADAMTRLYLSAGIGSPDCYTRVFSGFDLRPFLEAKNDPRLRQELGLPTDAFVIGKLARIAPLKGHEDLLRATLPLLDKHPKLRLLFVGDGSLRKAIESSAASLGLRSKVVFAGLVSPQAVPDYIGIMDCLTHLSYREALSRALPQALAAAKPVVAYDFDGADEVCLDGDTGFLVRTGDLETVGNRLDQLASDPQLCRRLGGNGQSYVRNHFSAEQLVDSLLTLYRQLLAKRDISPT